MADTSTNWILKLVDEVTAPMKRVHKEVEETANSYYDVVQAMGKYDDETKATAQRAVKAHKDLTGEIQKEQKQLQNLVRWLDEAGDELDPLSKAQIDFDIRTASTKIRRYKEQLTEVNHELDDIADTTRKAGKEAGKAQTDFSELADSLDSFDFMGFQTGFGGITQSIRSAATAAGRFAASPLGLGIAGVAGVGLIGREFINYNKAAMEANIITQQITKTAGGALDDARLRAKAIEETFGADFKRTLEIARNNVQAFDITYDEAFDNIEDGLIRGGMANDEFFDSMREYPRMFSDAGYSMREFQNIVNTGMDLGLYNDKFPDAIKEFNISIKEQTQASRDAMENAFGKQFTDRIFSNIRDASITPKQALAEIADEADRVGLNVQQSAQLTADLFRGAGEDAGGLQVIFEAINKSLNEPPRQLSETEEYLERVHERAKKVEEAFDSAFNSENVKSFNEALEVLYADIQIWFANGIEAMFHEKGGRGFWQQFRAAGQALGSGGWDIVGAVNAYNDKGEEIREKYAPTIEGSELDEIMQQQYETSMSETNNSWEGLVKKELTKLQGLSKAALENMSNTEAAKSLPDRNTALLEAISRQLEAVENGNAVVDKNNPNSPTQNDFGISGISGVGGTGKMITMNLDIKNYFEVAKDAAQDIEAIAEKIVGRVNDRLRDAIITVG